MKILALILSVGGVFAAFTGAGLPWFLALLPAGLILFFTLNEKVEEIVPPKPPQHALAYRSSWEEYRRLAGSLRRAWLSFGFSVLAIILAVGMGSRLSPSAQVAVFIIVGIVALVSSFAIQYAHWRISRWPCPHCGDAFRGFWVPPPIFHIKRCRFCSLPIWEENPPPCPLKSHSNHPRIMCFRRPVTHAISMRTPHPPAFLRALFTSSVHSVVSPFFWLS
jgi:hypothetical protein